MELMEGGTLRERIKKGLSIPESLEIIKPVIKCLSEVHFLGIIHRDIKPENILFTKNNVPKVADWGLVKALMDISQSSDGVKGTLKYLAPEQFKVKEKDIQDRRTDIYQLGAVLYEMVTGQPPFPVSDVPVLVNCILNEQVTHPFRLNSKVPATLGSTIMKCLEKEKRKRYGGLRVLLRELEENVGEIGDVKKVKKVKKTAKSKPPVSTSKEKCSSCRNLITSTNKLLRCFGCQKFFCETCEGWFRAERKRGEKPFCEKCYGKEMKRRELEERKKKEEEEQGRKALEEQRRRDAEKRIKELEERQQERYGIFAPETATDDLFDELLVEDEPGIIAPEATIDDILGDLPRFFEAGELEQQRRKEAFENSKKIIKIPTTQQVPARRSLFKMFTKKRKVIKTMEMRTNCIGIEFVLIPAGTFLMGSKESSYSQPPHQVTLSKPFYLGKYQVTQAKWQAIMGSTPSHFEGTDKPVERVSWNDCQEFIRNLNSREGVNTYRLPTEAEWEYACRAGTTTRFCCGDGKTMLSQYAWHAEDFGGAHPVGKKKANTWGLYDMHGNVWEWCQDWYGSYPRNDITDPGGPASGSLRVSRGGSWYHYAKDNTSACRGDRDPDGRYSYLGFRLARDL